MLILLYSGGIFRSYDLSKWIEVQKAKVDAISDVP
jgi:hypothetical protein